ncbi:helix-turn-helix domain-containing protein [Paenibacillus cymbidii]|uniref:helix-turn-helix domain-containing protein n=1 Tax=Paenibacillus cymbidii TaxID=1639034 RepID=UPI0014368728|nr:helix-turn-helix domain-containing protein [Paenibacillus cymbidii]
MKPFKTQKGFYKILLMFIAAISIPAVTIGYVAIHNSTAHIVRQVDMSSNILLGEKKLFIEQQLVEIDNLIKQIMASDEVWKLFESNDSYAARSEAMAGVIRSFGKIAGTNKSIVSIYLINKDGNYVLADSKYSLDTFFDQTILQVEPKGLFAVLPPRKVTALGATERNLLSAVRTFKDVSSNDAMKIVINIDTRDFVSSLQTSDNPIPMDLLIFNDSDQLILNNTGIKAESLQNQLSSIRGSEGSSIRRTLDKTDYFLSKTRSNFLGWTIIYEQPFKQVVDSAKLLRHVIFYSVLIVLLLSLAMAYLFSFYLYRPLARLVADIRQRMTTLGKGKDEYSLIGGAVNDLFQENRTLQSQFGLAFPYMKQHSLFKLLSGKVWEDEKLWAIVQLLGKPFDKPHFVVSVLEFENTVLTDPMVDEAELFFDQRLQAMLLSVMGERRLVLIVNTELEKDGIYALFTELKETLSDAGAEITMAISPVFDSLNKLFLAYQEALQLLGRKFFIGKNEIIVRETVQAADSNGRFYDKQLEEGLLDCIRTQNSEKAKMTVRDLLRMLAGQSSSIGSIKYAVFQICSNLIGALADMGGRPEAAGIDGPSIWDSVQQADTIAALEQLMISFIDRSMSVTEELKQKQHTEIVGKTMEFIQRHYRQNLSLKDISTNVYLSPGYLNTIFKTETGVTIYDYMTQVRMEAAAKLILHPESKVQDVAQEVGYNNAQSFNRLFKRTYRMTPLEYRRKQL